MANAESQCQAARRPASPWYIRPYSSSIVVLTPGCLQARAVYSPNEIILLDDPLAAVDTHVGDYIFETLRSSELVKGRLVVLVTSQMSRLPLVDRIVLISSSGVMLGVGTRDELMAAGHDLNQYVVEAAPVESEPEKLEKEAKMSVR